jgi:hypothetical protein
MQNCIVTMSNGRWSSLTGGRTAESGSCSDETQMSSQSRDQRRSREGEDERTEKQSTA